MFTTQRLMGSTNHRQPRALEPQRIVKKTLMENASKMAEVERSLDLERTVKGLATQIKLTIKEKESTK